MKISSTSALVLNWSDPNLYPGEKVNQYIKQLDLSEGDALMKLLDEEQHFMHTQAISARKYFMWTNTCHFLENCRQQNQTGQVIIMGAGISPLSAALAEQYPEAKIFDIDLYSMEEKAACLSATFPQISFIKADLKNIAEWSEALNKNNFNAQEPSIIIFEGIVYYLPAKLLEELFAWSFHHQSTIIGDFVLPPASLHPAFQKFPDKVFEVIRTLLSLPPTAFYSRKDFIDVLHKVGYQTIEINSLPQIHLNRTGHKAPFIEADAGWIECWNATAK